jgi:hypothetical protein
MLESGRKPPHFAQKAERRARFAFGYLVLLCIVLIVIFGAMVW